jgi:hypothetical protein
MNAIHDLTGHALMAHAAESLFVLGVGSSVRA